MIELLTTKTDSEILDIKDTGIMVYSSFYRDFTETKRYQMPDKIYKSLRDDNQILTSKLLHEAVHEFLNENYSEKFRFHSLPYQIGVPLIKYWN